MFASNQPKCPGVQLYNNEQLGRRGGGGSLHVEPKKFMSTDTNDIQWNSFITEF